MNVIGTAEEAISLSVGIVGKTKDIYDLTNAIKAQLDILQNSYQDEGFEEMRDIVYGVYQSIHAHLDDISGLQDILLAYAEILEGSKSNG